MTQLQDDLSAVLVLLDSPAKWTKGKLARDAEGNRCPIWSKDAVCWCIRGACGKIAGITSTEDLYYGNLRFLNLMGEIGIYLPMPNIARWNDDPDRTIEDIQGVLHATLDGCNGGISA
jgi:hypothetical protein